MPQLLFGPIALIANAEPVTLTSHAANNTTNPVGFITEPPGELAA